MLDDEASQAASSTGRKQDSRSTRKRKPNLVSPPRKRRKVQPTTSADSGEQNADNDDDELGGQTELPGGPGDVDETLVDTQQSVTEPVATTEKKPRKRKTKADLPEPIIGDYKARVQNDWKIGVHVSTAGGIENAVTNAAELGANAFALFLKSNRKWESPALSEESISKFQSRMKALAYDPSLVLPHSTYLINMANPNQTLREKAYQCFADDLRRCEQLGLTLCNFHPGSSLGHSSRDECLDNIAQCLNRAHKEFPTVVTVIECMAGTKNIIGSTFEELADIIRRVDNKSLVGICFDTCHMFCAGYDLRTDEVYKQTMEDFDQVIGISYLKGMHLNDSKTPFDSKKDRHENIGLGSLGLRSFAHIVADTRLKNLPLVLETPGFDLKTVWATEIDVLNQVSLQQQSGRPIVNEEEQAFIERVRDAVSTVEKNGWGAKGKIPKPKKESETSAAKGRRKRKAESDVDESEASSEGWM